MIEKIRTQIKLEDLEKQEEYRKKLTANPKLRYLFLELTDQCNLNCVHCGSHCSVSNSNYIDAELLVATLTTISQDFNPETVMVCLTGGEPLLHPNFEDIVIAVNCLGFSWGMTTNGTLIDKHMAHRLSELGMGSISVSLDGLRDTHNWFRGAKSDNYIKVIDAVKFLKQHGFSVQVTTVVHKKNIHELDEMYDLLVDMNVDSWRVINIEPMGRALLHDDLLLSKDEILRMLNFIRDKRFDFGVTGMDVCYGCSHYLSTVFERDVRDNCFMCGSGILVASILCNGDIYSCLDIERRPELIQGNIAKDRFSDVWYNRFKEFRSDRSEICSECKNCEDRKYCHGDSMHTWDFEKKQPRFCIKKITAGGV